MYFNKLIWILIITLEILIEFSCGKNLPEDAVELLNPPDKSELDKKEYRLFRIKENGLMALLISDKFTNDGDSQIGMTVGVGSSHDILIGVPGMAHFLEHMLFMGSEEFPEENSFDKFVTTNGGNSNAKTEYEHTLYYYSINDKALDESLNIFAQFFSKPLMLKDSITRERESIESEFQSAKDNFFVRYEQMLTVLANSSHPASYFSWGNLKSLKDDITDDELYDKVHEFFKKYYVPNQMYLSIQSSYDLDELQGMVMKYFSKIPNAVAEPEPKYNWEDTMTEDFFDKITYVKSTSDQTKMVFTWLLPSYLLNYKYKVLNYLSFILGDESSGSLANYLKNKLYCTAVQVELNTGSFKWSSSFTLYSLYITLTDKGYENIDEVISAVYSFLLFLEQQGPSEEFFKDIQQIKSNEFRFESNSRENAAELSFNMKTYRPEDIITGTKIMFEYNEELVNQTIARLNDGRMNLMIFTQDVETDSIEKWMNIKYRIEDYPEKYRKLWENREINEQFHYPKHNNFISSNFEIFYNENDDGENPKYPIKISEDDCVECWYRLDDKFLLPKAEIYVFFESPEVEHRHTYLRLYSMLIEHVMNNELYAAKQANYEISFSAKSRGIELSFSGYNEKIDQVLEVILNKMGEFEDLLTESAFETYKKELKHDCHEEISDVLTQNKEIMDKILNTGFSGCYDISNEIKDIKTEDLRSFSSSFLKTMKVKMLVQGNVEKSQALEMVNQIKTSFKCNAEGKLNTPKTRKIPKEKKILKVKATLHHSSNSAVSNYYQLAKENTKQAAELDLFVTLLKEPLFNILRTQQQLGYTVTSSVKNVNKVLGFKISIVSQEDKNSYKTIYDKIEDFLKNKFAEILKEFSEDEFESMKNSLIQKKTSADIELGEEVDRNWEEILNNNYVFDRPVKLAKAIAKLSLLDIQEFYKKKILNDDLRELSVQVVGRSEDDKADRIINNRIHLEMFEDDNDEADNSVDRPTIDDFINSLDLFENESE